jgi:hypothetical protein
MMWVKSYGRSSRTAVATAALCVLLLVGSPVFALSFLGKDRTPAPSSATPSVAVETTEQTEASLDSLDKTIDELSKTVNSLKAGQRLDNTTLTSLNSGLQTSAEIQKEYDKALKDANRIHFGIGAGVEYHQPTSFGVSVDGSLRYKDLLLVTGVTYFPINDGNVKDRRRVGGHASVLYEF